MNRQTQLVISIPNPCKENWDEMTPVDGGKHCNHCSKKVYDFTGYSDKQLYQFFEQNKGAICGLYLNEQVNRTIIIPLQPKSQLYRLSIAMGLTLLFSQPLITTAQSRPPIKQDSLVTKSNKLIGPENIVDLIGRVTNENKHPIANASITIIKNGVEYANSSSDNEGNFNIYSIPTDTYEISITREGYTTLKTTFAFTDDIHSPVNFKLYDSKKIHKIFESRQPKFMGIRSNYKLPNENNKEKK